MIATSADRSSLLHSCRSLTGMSRSAIPPLPTASSTGWSTMPFASNSPANPCPRNADANRRSRHLERGPYSAEWGKGDSNAVPLPHTPIPARRRKMLTDVNNLRHHANTSVATLRLYSHRVGTVHSHRRNPHISEHRRISVNVPEGPRELCTGIAAVGQDHDVTGGLSE